MMPSYFNLGTYKTNALPERQSEKRERARRYLHLWMKDPWYQQEMSPTFMSVSAALNYDISELRDFAAYKDQSLPLANRLINLQERLDKREIVLTKDHGAVFLPPQDPVLSPKLIASWTVHSTCLHCRQNHYLPMMMNEREHAACYHCLPPSQYKSMGAKPLPHSLLFSDLEKRGIIRDIERARPPEPKMKKLIIYTGARGHPFVLKKEKRHAP